MVARETYRIHSRIYVENSKKIDGNHLMKESVLISIHAGL